MSYLDRINECNEYTESNKIPFVLEAKRVGQVLEKYLDYFLESDCFVLEDNQLTLVEHLKTFDERTEALTLFAKKAWKDEVSDSFMDENYPLLSSANAEPLAFIDRSISALLGSISFGQHLNAYVMTSTGMKMWIARRAYNKGYEAGKLDHLVAGGLPFDISPLENLKKECYEEAGMSEVLLLESKSVGLISYKYDYNLGGTEDILYCYDIELAEEFVPVCMDGEVEEFYLMPIEEVAELVKNTDEFKLNCNLVIIDFLIRHGYLTTEDDDYIEIVKGLRS